MSAFDLEAAIFAQLVDAKAAELVHDGVAAPWEAIALARRIILEQRKAAAETRRREERGER